MIHVFFSVFYFFWLSLQLGEMYNIRYSEAQCELFCPETCAQFTEDLTMVGGKPREYGIFGTWLNITKAVTQVEPSAQNFEKKQVIY